MSEEYKVPLTAEQQDGAERAPATWRASIEVHPAAELFPLMSKTELAPMVDDIKTNGLVSPIALWRASKDAQAQLLDGRNRLNALELVLGRPVRVTSRTFRGRTTWELEADDDDGDSVPVTSLLGDAGFPYGTRVEDIFVVLDSDTDPYAYVTTANFYRRHLTAEQKRDAIAKQIKATPGKSDRQIAKTGKASPTFVGKVRAEMEAKGEVSTVDTRTDAKGVKQPARKTSTKPPPVSEKVLRKRAAAAERIRGLLGNNEIRDNPDPEDAAETAPKDAREVLEDELKHARAENIRAHSEIRELKAALEAKFTAISDEHFYSEFERRLPASLRKQYRPALTAFRRALDARHSGPAADLPAIDIPTDGEVPTKH